MNMAATVDEDLVSSVFHSDIQGVNAALNNGANVNTMEYTFGLDMSNNNILGFAITNHNMINILLKSGAFVDKIDGDGNTALINSFNYGISNEDRNAICKTFLRNDANIEKIFNGYSAFHMALNFSHDAKTNTLDTIKSMLIHGVDLDQIHNGQGFLHMAVENDKCVEISVEVVKLLLDCGIDINLTNCNQRTALHIASVKGNHVLIKVLLDYGVNHNILDDKGFDALYLASNYDKAKKVFNDFGIL